MQGHDVYLLAPELALVGLAVLVIGLDLVVRRKGWLAVLSAVGLLVPLGLAITLWVDPGNRVANDPSGPFGTLLIDKYALFFKVLVLAILGAVVLASVDYTRNLERYQGEFYPLLMFAATGMMLLAATTELITIYIALELATLPLAALAAFLGGSRSSEAGMKFLILGAISSAVFLYGIALVFGFTGTTHLEEIGSVLTQSGDADLPFGSYAVLVGAVLIVAGFGFKVSMVPFQMWVPDVYEGSPTPVAAFLSVASKAAGFAVLLRVFYVAFAPSSVDWSILFAVLAAASMTVGNVVAISQQNIKRLLGYSTIAHAGYLLIGIAAIARGDGEASATSGFITFGPSSLLFYLGAYAATNLAAFFAIIAISNKTGSDLIDDFAGMGQRAPFLAFALALALVALIGIPPTGIFIAKLYIFGAAIKSDLVWLAAVGVANSVVSAYYYLRVIRIMYLNPPASQERVPSSRAFQLALVVSVLSVLALGIYPGPLLEVAENAVLPLIQTTGATIASIGP